MKAIVMMMLAAAGSVMLSSCSSDCDCKSYSDDALRDIPVRRSASFY